MANIEATQKFLNYDGLTHLWGIINKRFSTKDETVTSISIADGSTPLVTQDIVYTNASGTPYSVQIPAASEGNAGLMSADHYGIIKDLKTNIDSMAPFAGLQIDGNEVSLTGRRANIKLKYEAFGDAANGSRTAFISLIDADYPTTGEWSETTEEDYLANSSKIVGRYTSVKDGDNGIKYYKWSEESAGPKNSVGVPLYRQPISQIDVSELVKTGLLNSADVVVNPAGYAEGTYLELVFNTSPDSETNTSHTVYINVTDLVEIYSGGEGIVITDEENTGADNKARTGKINVVAATDTSLGAIKTGYTVPENGNPKTYAVKLDSNSKAYVVVPWETVTVTAKSDGVNNNGKKYLETNVTPHNGTDNDGNPTVTYEVSIEIGDGLKNAETYAQTSIQTVVVGDVAEKDADGNLPTNVSKDDYIKVGVDDIGEWGKKVTVSLTDSAEDSLALADSAVQVINVTDYLDKNVEYTTKGTKTYTIDLNQSTKDSLALADSAVQTINMMGTEISKSNPEYTAAEAKLAMSLGSASEVNITTDNTLVEQETVVKGPNTTETSRKTVATTGAVKTYVDNAINTLDQSLQSYTDTKIESLDSSLEENTTSDVAHNYGDATQVYSKIVITDGLLDRENSVIHKLQIKDITDFAPLSNDDIDEICKLVDAE